MSKQTAWLRHREPLEKVWRITDAKGQVLGRLATQIANILLGKHKPTRLDNIDCSDPVVVINARHFELTGRKKDNKEYIHHTGYPGGLKRVPIHEVMDKRPEDALRLAVKRMLPTNKLRKLRMENLHIFPDEDHPYKSKQLAPMPPAHCGARLGKFGSPTKFELENWWLTHLSDCPDEILNEVMKETYAEIKDKRVGLAEILRFNDDEPVTDEERKAVENYIRLAEEEEGNDPVLCPNIAAP